MAKRGSTQPVPKLPVQFRDYSQLHHAENGLKQTSFGEVAQWLNTTEILRFAIGNSKMLTGPTITYQELLDPEEHVMRWTNYTLKVGTKEQPVDNVMQEYTTLFRYYSQNDLREFVDANTRLADMLYQPNLSFESRHKRLETLNKPLNLMRDHMREKLTIRNPVTGQKELAPTHKYKTVTTGAASIVDRARVRVDLLHSICDLVERLPDERTQQEANRRYLQYKEEKTGQYSLFKDETKTSPNTEIQPVSSPEPAEQTLYGTQKELFSLTLNQMWKRL